MDSFTTEKLTTDRMAANADSWLSWWLGGLLVERRTSVSQYIRGSIPGQVAAV